MHELVSRFGEHQLVAFVLVLGRLGPLFLLAPVFSSRQIPPRARSVIAVALAIGITPLAARGQEIPLDVGIVFALLVKEILIGLAFAFSLAAFMAARRSDRHPFVSPGSPADSDRPRAVE